MKIVMTVVSLLLLTTTLQAQEKETHTKEFQNPGDRGRAVSFCLSGTGGCGQAAADMFCANEGYERAESYVRGPRVAQSVAPDTEQVCRGSCDSFRSVVCTREVDAT